MSVATEPIHLTNLEARRFLLAKQGLWPSRALIGKKGIMAVFDRLACIQFDPLDVVVWARKKSSWLREWTRLWQL